MRIKQTKKRIILSAFVVTALGAAGFLTSKLFINNNKTNAEGGSIAINYDKTNTNAQKLGNPNLATNGILSKFSQDYFERLKSWSDIKDKSSSQIDPNYDQTPDSSGKVAPATKIANEKAQARWEDTDNIVFTGGTSIWHEGKRIAGSGDVNRAMRSVKYLEIPRGPKDWTKDDNNNDLNVSWTVTTDDGYTVTARVIKSYNESDINNETNGYQPFVVSETGNYVATGYIFGDNCFYARKDSHGNWYGFTEISENDAYSASASSDANICNTRYKKSDNDTGTWVPGSMPSGANDHYNRRVNDNDNFFVEIEYTVNGAPDNYYMKIDDIDAGQSYRFENKSQAICTEEIINQSGGSCDNTIFVKPVDTKCGQSSTDDDYDHAKCESGEIESRFQYNTLTGYDVNGEDNYIYYDDNYVSIFSSYSAAGSTYVNNPDAANIYIKFNDRKCDGDEELCATQNRTVDFVYGFSRSALSRWEFLTQTFNVTYRAQLGETLRGNVLSYDGELVNDYKTTQIYEGEVIDSDNIPTVYNDNTFNPNPYAQYRIDHWTADKEVVIDDVHYPAGAPITPSDMDSLADNLNIADDYTFTAHLAIREYTITWKNDNGTILETDTNVAYGSTPEYNGDTPTKDKTAQYVFTFAGWTPTISTVTGDATYTATFDRALRSDYTITWKNDNGAILETDTNVAYGSNPQYNGDTPTKAPTAQYVYTFAGWTPTPDLVTGDATYTAKYTQATRGDYTITWKNDDGTVLETDRNVAYGSDPQYNGDTPIKASDGSYTYEFVGWNPAPTAVRGDATYTAQYRRVGVDHIVTYYNEDRSTVVGTGVVEHGEKISMIPTPTKEPTDQYTYTFKGYLPMDSATPTLVVGETTVLGDYKYYAEYTATIRKHKISFVDDEGKPIEDILVDYGETPAPSAVPDKTVDGCTYSFSKWTPELVPVTGPATYKASYTKKECKEGTPNTGIGQNDDQASGTNIAIILAAFGALGTLAAAIACRVIKRQRTMKF